MAPLTLYLGIRRRQWYVSRPDRFTPGKNTPNNVTVIWLGSQSRSRRLEENKILLGRAGIETPACPSRSLVESDT